MEADLILRALLIPVAIAAVCTTHVPPVAAANTSTGAFIEAAGEIDAAKLDALALMVETDPRGVANELQSSLGGRKALQRYASAMLAHNQASRLGRQWASLLADRAELARSENKDGGIWFPQAEDAGFFTGGVAVALKRYPGAIPSFSAGAGMDEPAPDQEVQEWLMRATTLLPRGARSSFIQALQAGAVQ